MPSRYYIAMLTVDNPKKFDWSGMSLHDCAEGNALDSYFTLKLYNVCEKKLKKLNMMHLYKNLMSPATEVFSGMEYKGLDISQDTLNVVGKELYLKNVEDADSLHYHDQVKKEDNLSSTNDLIKILYTREDGFGLYPPDRTAKGSPSVAAPTLKIILEHLEDELKKRNV